LAFTLREEHRLRVSENKVLRRIFGSMRKEVAGGWRRIHNELCNLYTSLNIMRMIKSSRMSCAGYVARTGEMRNAYKIFVGNSEGKRPLLKF
jgi:hypothetical protein